MENPKSFIYAPVMLPSRQPPLQDSRAQTLHALDTFIANQRTLLTRQKSDIERLQKLRSDLRENPSIVLANLSNELDHSAFRLSAQTDLRVRLPNDIDWSVFDKTDTTPLRTFTSHLRQKYATLNDPHKTQQSPLSELQALVKTARKDLVDPVLEQVTIPQLDSDDEDSDEGGVDPLEKRRYEERMKILELKKRKIKSGEGGLRLLKTRNVVFVRNDVEDETGEVDVGSWGIGGDDCGEGVSGNDKDELRMDTERSSCQVVPTSRGVGRNARHRRATQKVLMRDANEKDRPRKKTKIQPLSPEPDSFEPEIKSCAAIDDGPSDSQVDSTPDNPLLGDTPGRKTQKSRSETYKQSWTTDEQNLLEQLLQTIPDGEKFRWQRISQAMGGRRTPRQVASRVQKYFEKLKKFGLAVE